MPTYTYCCPDCGHTFEEFKKVDERDAPTFDPCGECGNSDVSMLLSPMNIISGRSTNKMPAWYTERLSAIKDRAGASHTIQD